MKKGIIFTTDAILALIAVMLFIAWIPHQIGQQTENHIFENISEQARDKAITNFYEETTRIESINQTSEFGKCFTVYSINPSVGISPIEENVFCEET